MTNEKKYRVEADLLGELQVPADALYGVQTQRGINNYHISRKTMSDYPDFIIANAYVKLAAAQTNHSLGVINDEISGAISEACREIIDGKWHENFPIDMIQGGAGTSVNMNVNEVIANRALESWVTRRANTSIARLTTTSTAVRAPTTHTRHLSVWHSFA